MKTLLIASENLKQRPPTSAGGSRYTLTTRMKGHKHMTNLDLPQRPPQAGLFVFDFGAWTATGCTAAEIALLLESERFREGKVYRIQRVSPSGEMELRGIPSERFQLESGLMFFRDDADAAADDFQTLAALADETPAPCRAFMQLADRGAQAEAGRYVVALIYPAEYEDDIAAWLLDIRYAGGTTVEGGPSAVTTYYHDEKTILNRRQLWSREATPSRGRDELYAALRVG